MRIRRETREKARRSLAFSPVSKPHTHITYMLRQCTSIVYIYIYPSFDVCLASKLLKLGCSCLLACLYCVLLIWNVLVVCICHNRSVICTIMKTQVGCDDV